MRRHREEVRRCVGALLMLAFAGWNAVERELLWMCFALTAAALQFVAAVIAASERED